MENLKEEDGKKMLSHIYFAILFFLSISYLQKYNAVTFNCMGPAEPNVSPACWFLVFVNAVALIWILQQVFPAVYKCLHK